MNLIVLIAVLFIQMSSATVSAVEEYSGILAETDWYERALSTDECATSILSESGFDLLSGPGNVLGQRQMAEVKFLVTDVQSDSPRIYFINSNTCEYHWRFYSDVLDWDMSLYIFNTLTYTDYNRRMIAGSVIRYDSFKGDEYPDGIYCAEFWPSDPIHAREAALVVSLLKERMAFASDIIVYHPTGETQVRIFLGEEEAFRGFGIDVVQTRELLGGIDYMALNTGDACGILRSGDESSAWSPMDIVVFRSVPNDISHVAGVITTIPQTPLSHINLKAIQNGTPNVFIRDFTESENYREMLNSYVKLTAETGGYTLEPIPLSEALLWLEANRPDSVTVLERDLSETRILPLDELRASSSVFFGAKAASLGELTWCLPEESVPDGFAVPFFYYHEYMEHNNLYGLIDSLTALDEFSGDVESRTGILRDIRRAIRNGDMPGWMSDSLSVMASQFQPFVPLRCRSSTNNEDLPGFNGAGLYDSYTHHRTEGHISNTVRQVWAGAWTYRAFEEREFYRIEQSSVVMGIAVHPSYRDEIANGVAVTRNIYNPFITGYSVNVQPGEDMVTNPEPESVPEEFLITQESVTGIYHTEVQYIRTSNRMPEGERVLSEQQIEYLSDCLENIHSHFALIYGKQSDDPDFAMEIEFKIDSSGELIVKQARPWVAG